MKINAVINSETNNNTYNRFRDDFEIIDKLPAVGEEFDGDEVKEIQEVWLDSEQPNDEPYSYEFWEITVVRKDDDDEYEVSEIFATKIEEEEEA